MVIAETSIGTLFVLAGIALFRMHDDKCDKMSDEAGRTYAYMRENVLDPILQQILASPAGRHRPAEFFRTPEVVERLEIYKRHLFEFIEASHSKNEAVASLGLLWRVCLGAGTSTIAVAWSYEPAASALGVPASPTYAMVVAAAVVIPMLAVSVYLIHLYMSQNSRFKSGMQRLRGGLA